MNKKIKKLYDNLIDAIECNTEAQWQEENIKKALFDYIAAMEIDLLKNSKKT